MKRLLGYRIGKLERFLDRHERQVFQEANKERVENLNSSLGSK
jgi:hypothetical protein